MDREAQLQRQIEQVIERLRAIQRAIAGSRQPAAAIELQTLEALGRSYARLQRELQEWNAARGREDAEQ
ncbi:MAG: hypothetical protein PVI28_14770 [Gammaproteobacteria bacterium]